MKNIQNIALALSILILVLGTIPAFETHSQERNALDDPSSIGERIVLAQGNSLLPITPPHSPERVVSAIPVIVTAYSSTPDQTDDTPYITASGKSVRNGIVATNLLPMGTKIKIPALYGDRIFVVEDRMHPRKNYMVDIWFPTYWEAKTFGVKQAYIEVLDG